MACLRALCPLPDNNAPSPPCTMAALALLLVLALVSCAASVVVPPPQTWAAYTFFAGLRKDTRSEADSGGFGSESYYVNEVTRRSLALWNESWTRQGWTTRVLGPAEVRRCCPGR